jgi:ATP/maltotriose-dependent transcriptional regulator MalT
MADGLIGREAERITLSRFLDKVSDGPAVLVLEGQAGIGKTTLWKEGVAIGRGRGIQVLAAAPAESETPLPFATLGDLFQELSETALSQLPAPQRRALEVALLRADVEGDPAEQRVISVAALTTIRALANSGPLILAVDDVQWMDPPSNRVLQFALRRLRNEAVGILVAVRTPDADEAPLGLDKAFGSDRVETLSVGPLNLESTDELLRSRLGVAFSAPTLTQLHNHSRGNPFFALEIGRFLLTQGRLVPASQVLPLPESLRELVSKRLEALPASTREVLLLVSALSQPSEALLSAATHGPEVWKAGLERAVEARIIERHGGRLRFTHPLMRSVLYTDASPDRLRALHGRLAQVVAEPEERARHLALATEAPDSDVASVLESAAEQAHGRGAPDAAAALVEQARELTPPGRVEDARRRAMKAVDYHLQTGETSRARVQLEELLAGLPAGPARAHALHRLGRIRMWEETYDGAEQLLERALTEAEEDGELKRAVERDLVMVLMQIGKLHGAAAHARVLLDLAEESGDMVLLSSALALSVMTECLVGNGVRRENMEKAVALVRKTRSRSSETHPAFLDAELYLGAVLKWSDDFEGSREILSELLERISGEHAESGLAPCLFQLGELECWAGNWDLAEGYAKQGEIATRRSGQATLRALPLTVTALVQALRGSLDAASVSAHEVLSLAERSADTRFAMRALAILGFLELSRDDPGAAYGHLRRLRQMATSQGYGEPGVLRFEADEIEALVALGNLEEAQRLTEELEAKGKRLDRPWALATSSRCWGLLKAARGDASGAMEALVRALKEHGRLQQPFELGRTLVALGAQQRRSKERRLARETLQRAIHIFHDLGASLWAGKATGELARIGGRPKGTDELTVTERRVAELVAAGSNNREVAARLFISLKTVEANLSKIYQKLGLRSRSELASRMAGERTKK